MYVASTKYIGIYLREPADAESGAHERRGEECAAHLCGSALGGGHAAQRVGERNAALAHEAQERRALLCGHFASGGAHL